MEKIQNIFRFSQGYIQPFGDYSELYSDIVTSSTVPSRSRDGYWPNCNTPMLRKPWNLHSILLVYLWKGGKFCRLTSRALSSMVEQRTHNPLVGGSTPSGPTLPLPSRNNTKRRESFVKAFPQTPAKNRKQPHRLLDTQLDTGLKQRRVSNVESNGGNDG